MMTEFIRWDYSIGMSSQEVDPLHCSDMEEDDEESEDEDLMVPAFEATIRNTPSPRFFHNPLSVVGRQVCSSLF